MSMKGGLLNQKITITDPNRTTFFQKKSFHPYTLTWHGAGDYGFYVGLGPPPTKGEIGYKDFFCTVDSVDKKGKITKIEKYDTGFFARPDGDIIKKYLEKFENIDYITNGMNSFLDETVYDTLDRILNEGSMMFNEYYIHSYDNYDPGATVAGRPDGFKLLTHKVQKTIKVDGGKRKTRRVKKSNRKSNRKRRSNTKRHTRKH